MSLGDGAELRYLPPQLTDADYPDRARRYGAEGTSILRLQVDTLGQITSYSIAKSSGSPDLDDRGCLLYWSRARFEPKGTTQPITLQVTMMWRLEGGASEGDEAALGRK